MAYKYINSDYLDSISGDDPQMIEELVNMFRDQVKEIYEDMNTLHSQKNFLHLGMLAHKAKSSVAIMGMNELASMLKTFELSAKEGKNTELYMSYISKFGEDTKAAVSELDDLVKERLNKRG
ncbi:MAG TPA: Hpt domain-containing protein [Bacteroidales bacterium]|nr:Hpt domain-containing protein [Bacteroidales bacterium]